MATIADIHQAFVYQAARAEEALDKIKAIKRSEKDLAKNKARTKEEIAKLQEKVDNPPEHEAIDPINEELVRSISPFHSELIFCLWIESHQNQRWRPKGQESTSGEPHEKPSI